MRKNKILLLSVLGLLSSLTASAQRYTDVVDRGVVAVPVTGGNFVSWRMFGEEYYDTKYTLYRGDVKIAENLTVTNFKDAAGTTASSYSVEAFVNGVSTGKSAAQKAWTAEYFDVKLQPVKNRNGVTQANSNTVRTSDGYEGDSGYTINDVSLADVTGDGICEFIVKRNNRKGNLRQASNKTDFNLYECYKLDGTRLWWIDLGPVLMAGPDEQWDMIGYDWDMDGKAEMIMRGADNMIIHTATGKTINIGDMQAGFGNSERPEYMSTGKEYLLYLNGETGEPYGWNGQVNWTPMDYPLPQFEAGESYGSSAIWGDLGHRMMKHYFGAPYLDGRKPSIFLGRGCYTRHKFCALDVNPQTHELTQRWRWNCYDSGSAWFGNGFHNFQIADVDMDGRDEIMFGSMCIDDTGYGLSTTGLGHGDAQHVGDLDPYRWGLEQFTCQEGSEGNSYWNPTTGQIYYRKSDGGDDGRCLAGNFTNNYPGSQGRSVSSGVIGLSSDKIINTNGDAMSGGYSNLNMRIYWDGDLLDEIFNCPNGTAREPKVLKWGGSVNKAFGDDVITNNDSKCNPSAQGDILGDWREELVLRKRDNTALRIFTSTQPTTYPIYTLWHDHQYRNAMAWQCVGYNQPPHTSFFLGELEKITVAPPPLLLRGRTEVANGGTISTTTDHLLMTGYQDMTATVADGASPYILTVNAPAWVKGTGAQQAVAATPKAPARTIINYIYKLTGGAFSGSTRLVKQGEGTLELPNVVEKHTGNTDVWNGTLKFDGTMEQSPVWLNRHTKLISNGGQFLGGLQADYNATIYPGGQSAVGGITASALTLGFGSRIVFDVTDATAIDRVNASKLTIDTRDWEFGPKYKTPVFEFAGAVNSLPAGRYELGTVGSIEGNVEDILIEGISGKRFFLDYAEGKLALVLEDMRAPATIVWNGTATDNIWDLANRKNFLVGTESVYAAQDDDIIFNDDAATGKVVVKGAVSPKSITFNNETLAYTLMGDSILGNPTLTKNGKAKVTINNENRIGATVLNGGTTVVNALANLTGVAYGALGSAGKSITINDGAALSVSQPVITDQPFNVSGNVTLDVPASLSFTLNKGLKGAGAVVTKTGGGTLTLGSANTFGKLIVKAGQVHAIQSGNVDQLPATVEFQGGTLVGANMENTPGITNRADLVVPEGKTGVFKAAYRGTYIGTLTGAGTIDIYTGGIRCYFDGDWSAFTGTINACKENRQNKKSYDPVWVYRNAKGLPNATLNIAKDVRVSNEGKDVVLKRVTGEGALVGSGQWILDNDESVTMSTEVGITSDRTDPYGSTIAKASTKLVKRGSGKLSLRKMGAIYATLTVEDGIVNFNDAQLATSLTGGLATTVKGSGRLVGQGLLGSLTVMSGAEVIPCGSFYNETTPGTLKTTAMTRIDEGAVVNFLINASKQSLLQVPYLTMNGTVKVTFTGNYTPKLGDEFTLWNATLSFSGSPKWELPALPDGLYWDVSGLAQKQGVIRITDDPSGIGAIAAGQQVACEVYSLSGSKVATLQATKAEMVAAVRKAGVRPGTFIVKMSDGHRTEVQKVVVK